MTAVAKGIDVSHWQGSVDFAKVKKAGYDFVILKAGGSDNNTYTDSKFNKYYSDAVKAGLHVGAYYFVGKNFTTKSDGRADAQRFLKIIQGKKFDMPVFLDLETVDKKYKTGATLAAISFMDTMEKAGYFVGIYGSDVSTFQNMVDDSKLTKYCHWVAKYSKSSPKVVTEYGLWQYSSTGTVSGISGSVDLDKAYVDYPPLIKKKHKNGY